MCFRIRIRAVNHIGPGPFSATVKCQTKSLPPDPPRMECIAVTCNSIKLKWAITTINHPLSPSSVESSTINPRPVSYIIEMEGKDRKLVMTIEFNCQSNSSFCFLFFIVLVVFILVRHIHIRLIFVILFVSEALRHKKILNFL